MYMGLLEVVVQGNPSRYSNEESDLHLILSTEAAQWIYMVVGPNLASITMQFGA